jgi:hypothetical protein
VFELERGQSNLLAIALTLASVAAFHSKLHCGLAYALFCLAVQLKLYPAIFVLMFVRPLDSVAANGRRVAILAAANVAALAILGPRVLADFLRIIGDVSRAPYVWVGNHSLLAFSRLLARSRTLGNMKNGVLIAELHEHSGVLVGACLGGLALCLTLTFMRAWWKAKARPDPCLLLNCTICACLLPSVSHDYKLSILAAPVALVLIDASSQEGNWRGGRRVWLLILSAAYAATLFPYSLRPLAIANAAPLLSLMLVANTLLSQLDRAVSGHLGEAAPRDGPQAPTLNGGRTSA